MGLHTNEVRQVPGLNPLLQAKRQTSLISHGLHSHWNWMSPLSQSGFSGNNYFLIGLGVEKKFAVRFAACFYVSKVFISWNTMVLVITIFKILWFKVILSSWDKMPFLSIQSMLKLFTFETYVEIWMLKMRSII
jgi:hypothetical protein